MSRPTTGAPYDDLLLAGTPDPVRTSSLVEDGRPPFLTDAGAARAPRRLVGEHLGDG